MPIERHAVADPGARSIVERAFADALLRVGSEGLGSTERCRAALIRFGAEGPADVSDAVELVAASVDLLDLEHRGAGPTDEAELVARIEGRGLALADAAWVAGLWRPVLDRLWEGIGREAPVPVPGRPPGQDLRPQLTGFLGRHADLQALRALLAHDRLVTLIGPGGVGKTRLAFELAATATDSYVDGRWVAELAPIEPASDVVEAIAGSLGVTQRETATTIDAVVDWLAPRTVLVLLDNCEHVVDAVRTFVERVLRLCPGVTFLLTSREALALDGERCWLTRPLALPPTEVEEPDEASRYEAIELFVARATAVDRDFGLSPENVGTVAAICRRLDGIPLALELAAARLPALGPVDLLDHLDQRFHLLVGSRREPRRTLRGTVDWSYGLLDDEQRLLFRRLAVFAGSWSLDACQTVCSDDRLDADDVLDVLTELVAKSLVATETTPTGTRYQMLETLRQYGQERMDEQSESDGICRRHAQWARGLVQRVAPGLKGRAEKASGDLVRADLDNLRVALRWAITNVDADVAFGIIGSLEDYTILRLDFETAAWAEQVLSVAAWADHPRRHYALGLVAYAAWARGDHDTALARAREALSVERRHRSEPSWAAWQSIGDAAWFRGWPEQAMGHYADWVERARQVGDAFALSSALAHLAVATSFLEGSARQPDLADEALALARRCDSPYLIALTLYAKSECVIDDDPSTALGLVEEAATIGRESGNRFAYGLCLTTLASLTGRLGDPADALPLYRLAVDNWRAAGNWTNQRILLRNLAEFAPRIGEYELTARLLAALGASGEMLGPDIGREGARLAYAIELAREALGDDRYGEAARQGSQMHPVALVRDTAELLDRLSSRSLPEAASVTPTGAAPIASNTPLSPREWEVVDLVAAGLTNRVIADRLLISERTVDTHITRVRRKLGTTTRTELAIWGLNQRKATSADPVRSP